MKTRFLCLLGWVTVILSYAPLVQAGEALQFDMTPKDLSAASENVWMSTAATSAETPAATQPRMEPGKPEATAAGTGSGTGEETEPIPVTIVPKEAIAEPPIKPVSKPDRAAEKVPPPAITPAAAPADKAAIEVPVVPAQPAAVAPVAPPEPIASPAATPAPAARRPVELGFGLPPARPLFEPSRDMPHVPAAPMNEDQAIQAGTMTGLFTGNANSLVAKAVGSAEGTRTPEGDRTRAYYGHVDPGNRVWNRGSFSYQHSAQSPEDADRKQLHRLANQAKILEAKAAERGLQLTVEEKLNGIDLANQAPKAALDRDGYIDWLVKAHQRGLKGSEAVLWARTRSFINPVTHRWDAPGLGNTGESIQRDQARRMEAIARAIAVNQRAVDHAVKTANAPAAADGAAPMATPDQEAAPDSGIAQVLAEKLVEMFGGENVPSASTPLVQESAGIQQLFGFAF